MGPQSLSDELRWAGQVIGLVSCGIGLVTTIPSGGLSLVLTSIGCGTTAVGIISDFLPDNFEIVGLSATTLGAIKTLVGCSNITQTASVVTCVLGIASTGLAISASAVQDAENKKDLINSAIEILKKGLNVTTLQISFITSTTSVVGGSVLSDGNSAVTEYGIYWSTSQDPETTGAKLQIGSGIGPFTTTLSGLIPNTTYYLKAYAINSQGIGYGDQVSFTTSASAENGIVFNPNLSYGSITDVDGNVYKTIQIGTQTWMAENLKTTKYNDYTDIPLVNDNNAWLALATPGYCWYSGIQTVRATYGALYDWYALDATSNGGKNVCPTEWHVPSDVEWTTLTSYLGGEGIANDKLKEIGVTHWQSVYLLTDKVTNESGFTALPGGMRNSAGFYSLLSFIGYYWSTSELDINQAWFRSMSWSSSSISRMSELKNFGYSVRCLKDN
jgi:uncharacterized protein (TIGR02145 family)